MLDVPKPRFAIFAFVAAEMLSGAIVSSKFVFLHEYNETAIKEKKRIFFMVGFVFSLKLFDN